MELSFCVPIWFDSDGYTYSSETPLGLYHTYEEAAQRIREYSHGQEPREEGYEGSTSYGYIKILGIGDWDL